jgi:hypothetical protein
MIERKQVTDNVSVQRATFLAKEHVEDLVRRAEMLNMDAGKEDRLKKCLCLSCYYVFTSRIGGAAITTRACGVCGNLETYSSTNTDALCIACAKVEELCKHCGGDMKLRVRRIWRKA